MARDMDEFIRGMPKAELHLHLEGTLEAEMWLALAERNGLQMAQRTAEELATYYRYEDLASFLALYFEGLQALRTERDFYELAYAYLRRVSGQNDVCAEMHFDPQAHTSRGVAFESVIEGIRAAQIDAERDFGIRSQLIMGILRDMPAESAMETLDAALPYRDWIVGLGLDSDEKGNPPSKFTAAFARARAERYMLTMHCDHLQENSVEHIRQCLDVIGVDRIDHGYHILDDAGLARRAADTQICLTFCATATPTNAAPRRVAELKRALDMGLNVTLNTDDPAYMRGYYLNELIVNTQRAGGLTREQVARLAGNAFRSAWIAAREREGYLAKLDAYVAESGGATLS